MENVGQYICEHVSKRSGTAINKRSERNGAARTVKNRGVMHFLLHIGHKLTILVLLVAIIC